MLEMLIQEYHGINGWVVYVGKWDASSYLYYHTCLLLSAYAYISTYDA